MDLLVEIYRFHPRYVHSSDCSYCDFTKAQPPDTEMGYISAMSEMILQQMIADAYTDARIIWDQNETKAIQGNDDVSIHHPLIILQA